MVTPSRSAAAGTHRHLARPPASRRARRCSVRSEPSEPVRSATPADLSRRSQFWPVTRSAGAVRAGRASSRRAPRSLIGRRHPRIRDRSCRLLRTVMVVCNLLEFCHPVGSELDTSLENRTGGHDDVARRRTPGGHGCRPGRVDRGGSRAARPQLAANRPSASASPPICTGARRSRRCCASPITVRAATALRGGAMTASVDRPISPVSVSPTSPLCSGPASCRRSNTRRRS